MTRRALILGACFSALCWAALIAWIIHRFIIK